MLNSTVCPFSENQIPREIESVQSQCQCNCPGQASDVHDRTQDSEVSEENILPVRLKDSKFIQVIEWPSFLGQIKEPYLVNH